MISSNYGGSYAGYTGRSATQKPAAPKANSFEDALASAFTSVRQEEADFAKTLQSWHTKRPF